VFVWAGVFAEGRVGSPARTRERLFTTRVTTQRSHRWLFATRVKTQRLHRWLFTKRARATGVRTGGRVRRGPRRQSRPGTRRQEAILHMHTYIYIYDYYININIYIYIINKIKNRDTGVRTGGRVRRGPRQQSRPDTQTSLYYSRNDATFA